jgi:primosomal protein N' (replication factor Y)
VSVVPDVPAINREFDYLVPDHLADQVRVGTIVRVELHGRRVGGWIVRDGLPPRAGINLRTISRVTGWGPPSDVVELSAWASWRWAGRRSAFLRTASPETRVSGLPRPAWGAPALDGSRDVLDEALASGGRRLVLRLPPAEEPLPVVLAAAGRGPTLVIAPASAAVATLADGLRQAGVPVAVLPGDWAQAAAGAQVVLGTRAAAWAPCPNVAAVVVLDGHDERLQQEQAPTWNGWVVAAERAARGGVPCIVVSPCPTVELLSWGCLTAPSRSVERRGWAALEVVDRRRDDPRTGLYSVRLVNLLRTSGRAVCVLNRKGRARLLACAGCGELARCEECGGAVGLGPTGQLTCSQCGATRPAICLACGSTRLRLLRTGVSRAREELEALAGRPVGEVTAETSSHPDAPVLVGTEAVLYRLQQTDAVAFLDFDQELLAPRFRAGEEALALLALAARLVGGRQRHGRVLIQTRLPHHEVIQAALLADPGRLAGPEAEIRRGLRLPPHAAVALVSGQSAPAFVAALGGVEVAGPASGRWLVKAPDHETLLAALAATPRPAGRLRIEVDPLRL